MVDTMRAERFYADSEIIAVEDIPIPEPGRGEVLVKVAFCGICHSDLSLINGTFLPQRPVVTQGHEASGAIAKLGPDVTGWAEGDRVIVAAGRPCMTCPNCRRGDVMNCLRVQLMAFAYDGAWAEYTVAQAVGLTRVPDNVPLEQAAILADAVSTPFGAVVRTGQVGIGESVGVWGVGGVGTHIVQLARLVGAVPVIAVDIKPEVLDRAVELGADYAYDSGDPELRDKIAEITGGRMLDVAFDAVGLKSTFEQALDCITVGGRLVGVGMSAEAPSVGHVVDGVLAMNPTAFFPGRPCDYWSTRPELLTLHGEILMSAGGLLVERDRKSLLIDAGVGTTTIDFAFGDVDCGSRLDVLRAVGRRPENIDVVAFTHLHFDHAGWAFANGAKTFPNARYVLAAQELAPYASGTHRADRTTPWHVISRLTADSSSLDLINDDDEIFPNVRAMVTPGHSPGHTSYVIASRAGRRLVALGDAFHTPGQLTHPEWLSIADPDPQGVQSARRRLLAELAKPDTIGFGFHFGDQPFGRVTTDDAGEVTWAPVPTSVLGPPPR